jgi:uncharacterized protein DUF6879
MRKLINPADEFVALFPTVVRSSWRWECQGDYTVDHDNVRRWRNGEPDRDDLIHRDWVRYISGLRQAGIPFERVRMLTEPLTDYLTWMLAITNWNIDAGEDIRWIKESKARELGVPDYDFYIFDDNRVVIMNFGEDKLLINAELVDDEDVLEEHRAWRDRVWPHAVRHRDFLFDVIKKGVETVGELSGGGDARRVAGGA